MAHEFTPNNNLCLTFYKNHYVTFRCFRHLCRIPGLVLHLTHLSTSYDTSAFIASFLDRLVPPAVRSTAESATSSEASDTELPSTGRTDYTGLLTGILQDVQLNQHCTDQVSR